jgi:hypothetical protein
MESLHEFRRRVQSKTSRSRTQVKLWSWGATIHKSEQPCTSAGTPRAGSQFTLSRSKRRPRIDFKVLVTWAPHPRLQSTCIGRHRNALAYSPCLAFGFFFPHVEASFDPTITELEQHAVPAFDRSGSTFALKIFSINTSLRLYVRSVLAAPAFNPPLLGIV